MRVHERKKLKVETKPLRLLAEPIQVDLAFALLQGYGNGDLGYA